MIALICPSERLIQLSPHVIENSLCYGFLPVLDNMNKCYTWVHRSLGCLFLMHVLNGLWAPAAKDQLA